MSSNDNAESRELYSEGIYSLAYHQLTVNQKYVVDAAVDVGNTRPQPRFTEAEIAELLAKTVHPRLFSDDEHEAHRAASPASVSYARDLALLAAKCEVRALIASGAVTVREG